MPLISAGFQQEIDDASGTRVTDFSVWLGRRSQSGFPCVLHPAETGGDPWQPVAMGCRWLPCALCNQVGRHLSDIFHSTSAATTDPRQSCAAMFQVKMSSHDSDSASNLSQLAHHLEDQLAEEPKLLHLPKVEEVVKARPRVGRWSSVQA